MIIILIYSSVSIKKLKILMIKFNFLKFSNLLWYIDHFLRLIPFRKLKKFYVCIIFMVLEKEMERFTLIK